MGARDAEDEQAEGTVEPAHAQSAEPGFDALLRRAASLTPLPLSAQHGLHVGTVLCGGRFKILRRLGAGGMGVVHEAFDLKRGQRVALKTLLRLDPVSVYWLKNEFRALADFNHPNLVRLYELFGDDGLWLFTMELVAGQPFDRFVRESGALDLARLRAALPQLVSGVRAIHAAGKLHRDLKPTNLLVTDSGRVVILDLGLVADRDPGGEGQTLADEWIPGTPAYMAPELFEGVASSRASDWYSVGVTLFEALAGRLPFEGSTNSLWRRKRAEPAPRAAVLSKGVPTDLDELCSLLLARDPAARPDDEAIARKVAAHAPAVSGARLRASAPPQANAPLIGREGELERLRAAFRDAAAGHAVALRVIGQSGIGKSSLVGAFLDELRAEPSVVVLSGRCYERESVPYKAFDRVVDELTRYLRRLREVEAAALLPRDAAALARIFPVLGRIELVATAPERQVGAGQELRRHAFEAFSELLARMRDRHMVVLHIDDLQWLDHDSLLLLEHLLSHTEPAPLLFVASYRPPEGESHPLQRVESTARTNRRIELRDLELGPLAPKAARELAQRMLGKNVARELAEAVATEANGSPFFVGELARYTAEHGQPLDHAPMSLEVALRARAQHLGAAALDMLQLLAVSGRPTPLDVIADAKTLAEPQPTLDLLRDAQLVRDAGAGVYECYHDRIRAALAEGLEAELARSYHEHLLHAWSARPDADPEVLFQHCLLSGRRDEAGRHAIEAAANASSGLAFERSAVFLGHAIELMPNVEVERLNLEERRAEALSLAGRWADAAQAYAAIVQRQHEPARSAELLHKSTLHFLGSGHSQEGLPRLRLLFEQAGLHWPRTRFFALLSAFGSLSWLWLSGSRTRAQTAGQAGGPKPGGAPSERDALVLNRLLEAAGLVPPYDQARGLYFMAEFARRALRGGERPQVGVALGMLSAMFAWLPLTRPLSRRLSAEACALARSHQVNFLASATLNFVAWAHYLDNRSADALALSLESEDLVRGAGQGHFYELWSARTVQSIALLTLGRVGEAAERFEANARLAREAGDDMAVLGGDSVLRHLVADDLERARELLAHKADLLARMEAKGGLQAFVQIEHVMCALYEGLGGEVLRRGGHATDAARFALVDASVLHGCCALQAWPGGGAAVRRVTKRTLRKLRRNRSPAGQAMVAQFEAVMSLIDADIVGARANLLVAAERYRGAEMALHEALMRVRYAELSADPEAKSDADQARRWLLAQGIVRPDGWLRMLAPGLELAAYGMTSVLDAPRPA